MSNVGGAILYFSHYTCTLLIYIFIQHYCFTLFLLFFHSAVKIAARTFYAWGVFASTSLQQFYSTKACFKAQIAIKADNVQRIFY